MNCSRAFAVITDTHVAPRFLECCVWGGLSHFFFLILSMCWEDSQRDEAKKIKKALRSLMEQIQALKAWDGCVLHSNHS